jgi:hypothetical protein
MQISKIFTQKKIMPGNRAFYYLRLDATVAICKNVSRKKKLFLKKSFFQRSSEYRDLFLKRMNSWAMISLGSFSSIAGVPT